MKPTVAIIGAGAMGSIMGDLMKKNVEPIYWDAVEGKVPRQLPLEHVVRNAIAVLLCVPSGAVRPAAEAVAPFLKRGVPVVTIAKGVEAKTGKFMPEVLKEALRSDQPYGLISGPMLASELKVDKGGMGIVAVSTPAAGKVIMKLFAGSSLNLMYSKELAAVALAGVLKNVYAVMIGVALGLDWGHNKLGKLISDEVNEMLRIFGIYKLPLETVVGPAGLGDLMATGLSADSRNHQTGKKLVLNEEAKSEGTKSHPFIFKKAKKLGRKNVPLLFALDEVLRKKKTAHAAFGG